MARRATKINQVRADVPYVLLVDAGNALAPSEEHNPFEPAFRTRGQTSVDALNRLGYDAVALGRDDLTLGQQVLRKRVAEAKGFSFVSANLLSKATGELFTKPYVIKRIAGYRVALIGLTGGPLHEEGEFSLVPPLEAAREVVQQVKPQAEIIVLLSSAGAGANRAIAASVPGVDLIISGGAERLATPVQPVPGTLVAQAESSSEGQAGRYLGKLQVGFDQAGELTGHSWEAIELNASVADDVAMTEWVKALPPR